MSLKTIIAKSANLDITPGEVVLGNRIRMVFPARVRDAMLPEADPDLVARVRAGVSNGCALTQRTARVWVVATIHNHQEEWDPQERELAHQRVGRLFSGDVL